MTTSNEQPKRPIYKNPIFLIIGSLLILCCLTTFIITSLQNVGIISRASTDTPLTGAIETGIAQTMQARVPADQPSATTPPEPTQPPEKPTEPPPPTNTPEPTDAPTPTDTPLPTSTPTPLPEPISYPGQGDTILDIDLTPFNNIAAAFITGNPGGHHFAVIPYAANGDRQSSLVNTTEPYQGYRPLNLNPTDPPPTRLEIKAEGPWEITILPLSSQYFATLAVPGSLTGTGDNLILLTGGTPDLANITGNAGAHHFAVIPYTAYGDRQSSLVNTTDPYQGTVIVESDTAILDVKAEGDWTIEITAK